MATRGSPAQETRATNDPRDCEPGEAPPVSLVAPILEHPPTFPGWPVTAWRRALGSSSLTSRSLRVLGDVNVGSLLAWVAARTDPKRRMGAAADVLATLDQAVCHGQADAVVVGTRVLAAADAARPLPVRSVNSTRTRTTPDADGRPEPLSWTQSGTDGSLTQTAATLLRHASLDLRTHPHLARRLAVALDLAVEQWLSGSPPGAGLPPFPGEHERAYGDRLFVKLGPDRDLLRLVAGPHPGRGRNRQVAWQRGLAYWVGVVLAAGATGEAPPSVPSEVIAHWRKELAVLITPVDSGMEEPGLDSRYVATA